MTRHQLSKTTGLHHVTAFATDPTRNARFYTEVFGLSLVKRTVNFDDPYTWHLYFGDAGGRPGTLLTHFPNPRMARGTHGTPEIVETVLCCGRATLDALVDRAEQAGVAVHVHGGVDGDRWSLEDPDGMRLSVGVEAGAEAATGLRLAGTVVRPSADGAFAGFLTGVLGFVASTKAASRFEVAGAEDGDWVEIDSSAAGDRSKMGAGTVHHVAWRVDDEAAQLAVADALREAGLAVTPVLDRQYFQSIYCRVPGGVIFEFATDGPGFAVDEPAGELGRALKLPAQYETRRAEIEARLPRFDD